MKMQHRLFAHHYILTGDKEKAYKATYPDAEGEALKTAARRLINHPEVRELIHSRLAELEEHAAKEHHAEQQRRAEEEYATMMLKRKVLRNIISGQKKQLRHFKFKDHLETIEEELSVFATIRAIELDTKLATEWYTRDGKGTATTQQPARPKADYPQPKYTFEQQMEAMYGPDYVPALRAQDVRDNPRKAEEYRAQGLRVLDRILEAEDFNKMKEEHQQRIARWAELKQQLEEEIEEPEIPFATLPDPDALPTRFPEPPAAAPTTKQPTAIQKVQVHVTRTPMVKEEPPAVNPMSVVPKYQRPVYTDEEMQNMLLQHRQELANTPGSMYYTGGNTHLSPPRPGPIQIDTV